MCVLFRIIINSSLHICLKITCDQVFTCDWLSVLQVGCEGHLWKQYVDLVQRLQQQAHDGTLSEVLMQSVVGWHVKTAVTSAHRERREVPDGVFYSENILTHIFKTCSLINFHLKRRWGFQYTGLQLFQNVPYHINC
jgi:hypothetical protein